MLNLIDARGSSPNSRGGRSFVSWTWGDGRVVSGLLEWTAADTMSASQSLSLVSERVPNNWSWDEEARTLKVGGVFNGGLMNWDGGLLNNSLLNSGPGTAIFYECPHKPMDLREMMLSFKKPSMEERRALARTVVLQVRSLHVHYHLVHTALRTESFVFFGHAGRLVTNRPFIIDWARESTADMYQHPQYQSNETPWFYQAWSLLMIVSEIAEWQPLGNDWRSESELPVLKRQRREMVVDPDWGDRATAKLFAYGFGVLEGDRNTLLQATHWDIKCFYDVLCAHLSR